MYTQHRRNTLRFHRTPDCGGFGKITAIAILAVAVLVFWAVHVLSSIPARPPADGLAAAAIMNLNAALYAYASDQDKGFFPPVAPYPGIWTPDLRLLYPKYLKDPDVLVSPLLPDAAKLKRQIRKALSQEPPNWEEVHRVAAQSILYTGYAMQLEADLEHFIAAGMPRSDEDVLLNGQKMYRLRTGIERFFITEQMIHEAAVFVDGISYVMEQPALAQMRSPAGLFMGVCGGTAVQFVPFGVAFPAVELMKITFPPPNL